MSTEKKPRCSKTIFSSDTPFCGRGCFRNGVIEENGKTWCKLHAPSLEKIRHAQLCAKWQAKHDAEAAARRLSERIESLRTQIVKAVSDNPPTEHLRDLVAQLKELEAK